MSTDSSGTPNYGYSPDQIHQPDPSQPQQPQFINPTVQDQLTAQDQSQLQDQSNNLPPSTTDQLNNYINSQTLK
ncbi:hypothetical protein N7523_007463 [Penicillium sp. IBT 18751x]|nr:hypothetical protein N7523_007463 [Penicillium sp. IBT 18751x]